MDTKYVSKGKSPAGQQRLLDALAKNFKPTNLSAKDAQNDSPVKDSCKKKKAVAPKNKGKR